MINIIEPNLLACLQVEKESPLQNQPTNTHVNQSIK